MLVKVKDIHKSFGTVQVLKGVTVEIAQSEIYAICKVWVNGDNKNEV